MENKLNHCVASHQNSFLEKKIIIIGAGVAGLSSAYHLRKNGFKNVVILEARDRIGGRMHTLKHGSNFLEMGAQWIHGQKGNKIYELAAESSLVDTYAPDYSSALLQMANFGSLTENEDVLHIINFLEEKVSRLSFAKHNEIGQTSLSNYLQKHFEKYMLDYKDNPHMKLIKQASYQWYSKLLCELNGCNNLASVSCKLLHNYRDCEGPQTIELKFGYLSVLTFLLENIPSEWILKNKKVCVINWEALLNFSTLGQTKNILQFDRNSENLNPVNVILDDSQVFTADHVIITIPLGCLKVMAKSMFVPMLPYHKMEAIQCLGFGVVNKIYLEFGVPFWKETSVFNMLWIADAEQETFRLSREEKNVEDYWSKFINRFAFVPHHPNMLCAWITGEGACFMEMLSDEQVISECLRVLEVQLKRTNLPHPCRIIRTNWASDPYSQGSYSYLSILCEKTGVSNADLAEPVSIATRDGECPILLFAGEATHPHFYSTVHGAYETGIREADRIFSYYKKPNQVEHFGHHVHITKKVNTIIVGAGAAGLSCAQRLADAGLTDILVLEAQHKTGGRISTLKFGDFILELGAQWVHGEELNPLYEYSKRFGLLTNSKVDFSFEGKGLFCTSSGEIVADSLVEDVILTLDKIKEMLNCPDYKHTENPLSITEVFHNGFEKYLAFCDDPPETECIKRGIFDWYMRFEVIDNACDNLQDVTTLGYAEWLECPGVFHINFKDGFQSFIESLVNQIPLGSIILSKPVKCIYWQKSFIDECSYDTVQKNESLHSFPVLVECVDGDCFAADNVTITSSVGCLKSTMDSFFIPQLPEHKKKAISNLGFGTINKIYLVFSKPFWEANELGYQLVWIEGTDAQKQFLTSEHSWVCGISGFDIVRKQPNVLVAWIGGPEAKQMEAISKDVVGQTCVHVLRQFLNKPDIQYPIEVIRSCWNSNQYIKGAYSSRPRQFYDAGCTQSDLVEPLHCAYTLNTGETVQCPVVTFAGEAMDQNFFSAVHGALRSGWREADRLLEFFRTTKKIT